MSAAPPIVDGVSTALYRRYRPETFADVIGQEHVTGPLMAALDNGRVTHAYLFSGPRGCGKTTSARIFARCLNCAQGPTSTPCGTCDSCVELARGGAGSIDVVEMDAASHGGVDDARELRERAAFAPARDRYKVFIIDEAHMVSTQGFNALLKLVEEPPPHVKFVFATTEPEKVIGTIRSRTHHYPFRLVPPEQLTEYLSSLAEAEGIQVASGVLPLVVRAGGGSVRDSLSVLDQLIAGTDDGSLGYERAVALLGFTHDSLLDDTVDALAARDGASLFQVVDRVIESGHAPRRFVEDLLERLRDLIVVRAAGEQAASVLRAVPVDQLQRMQTQASHLSPATLSRAADLVNEALTEMAGATSPRLQLELLCARLLLPSADDGAGGLAARLEWLEGAVGSGQVGSGPAGASDSPAQGRPARPGAAPTTPDPSGAAPPAAPATGGETAGRSPQPAGPGPQEDPGRTAAGAGTASAAPDSPAGQQPEPRSEPTRQEAPAHPPAAAPPPADPATTAQAAVPDAGALSAAEVRRRWPEVLDTLARIKRTTWALISQDAQIVDLDAATLRLGFSTSGLASAFRTGQHAEFLQRALVETLGLDVRIEPIVADGSAGGGPAAPGGPGPAGPGGPGSGPGTGGPGPGGPGWSGPPATDPPGSTGGGAAADPGWGPAGGSPAASSAWDAPGAAAAGSADPEAPPSATTPAATPAPGSPPPPSPTSTAPSASSPPPWDVEEPVPADPVEDGVPQGSADEHPPAQPTPSPAPSAPSPSAEPPASVAAQAPAPPTAPQSPGTPPGPGAPPPSSAAPGTTSPREQALAAAREARRASLSQGTTISAPEATPEAEPDLDLDPSDPDIESTGLSGAPLVARLLGGTVIDEILESDQGGDR